HWSRVQGLLSEVQAVPAAFLRSVGQLVLVPVQFSAKSHSSTAARHWTPALPAGCVHVTLVPLHTSMVQGLVSAVQAVPLALKASVGQAVLVPVQFSGTSHSPAEGRQTVVEGWKTSAGQLLRVPLQLSATSHGPAAARQTVPAAFTSPGPLSAGHVALVPVHVSGRSHRSVAARQSAPALPAG